MRYIVLNSASKNKCNIFLCLEAHRESCFAKGRFQIPMAASVNMTIFWDTGPCTFPFQMCLLPPLLGQ